MTSPEHVAGECELAAAPPVRPAVPPVGAVDSADAAIGTPEAQRPPRRFDERGRVTPLAPGRFGVQFTMDQESHDLLRHAEQLLGYEIPPGDVAEVFKRALQALVPQLERRKFAATAHPRKPQSRSADSRHIPADIRRAVWRRDGGQCTFVSASGHRCNERRGLQFDHVEPFARGGASTVSGIRLRCHAHNQLEAERTFGAEFMRHKRLAAAEARAAAKGWAGGTATAAREHIAATAHEGPHG